MTYEVFLWTMIYIWKIYSKNVNKKYHTSENKLVINSQLQFKTSKTAAGNTCKRLIRTCYINMKLLCTYKALGTKHSRRRIGIYV